MRVGTTQITTIAATTASWGVVSGFGLFAKLWPEGRGHPLKDVVLKLFVVLALAVVVAAFLDWLKEHLSDEPYRPRGWSMSRVLTAVVILASFELVAVALDNVVETWWERQHEVAALAAVVTSPEEQWAFIAPDDILDASAMRAALVGTKASRAAHRVQDLMPPAVVAQIGVELERDRAITTGRAAWAAWRGNLWGSATDQLVRGVLPPTPELPPIRSREEVTEGRRILAEAGLRGDGFRQPEI